MAYQAFVQNADTTHHILFQIKQALSVAKAQKVLLKCEDPLKLV